MTPSCAGNRFRNTILTCGLIALAAATASAQHPAIFLMDHNGDLIDPVNGEDANAAFSIKQTCGMCHDYDVITEGYHFQMGWDIVSDDFGVEEGRPWSLSNGFLGRWYPYSYRQLAKKTNSHADEIDLTVYDFVGFSSPGPRRTAVRRLPPRRRRFRVRPRGQSLRRPPGGISPSSLNRSTATTTRASGTRAAWSRRICMICHLEGYDFDARVDQLKNGNYRWAVVAGSRLAQSTAPFAAAASRPSPTRRGSSTSTGPSPWTCRGRHPMPTACTATARPTSRSVRFSWNDILNPDIHNQQGISCTACHPAGLDHQIAKGNEPAFTVAPEYEGSNKSCAECHMEGYLGRSGPGPRLHPPGPPREDPLRELSRPAAQPRGGQRPRGHHRPSRFPPSPDGRERGRRGRALVTRLRAAPRRHDLPDEPLPCRYWANRDADGLVYPLFLREQEVGWKASRTRWWTTTRTATRRSTGRKRSLPASRPSPRPSKATSASSRSDRSSSSRRSPTSSMKAAA